MMFATQAFTEGFGDDVCDTCRGPQPRHDAQRGFTSSGSRPEDSLRCVLQCLHHLINHCRLNKRLVALDVDHDVVLGLQLADCLMTPLCSCQNTKTIKKFS